MEIKQDVIILEDWELSHPNTLLEPSEYDNQAWSENTKRSYLSLWNQFCTWRGSETLPVSVVVIKKYIEHLARKGKSFSTIDTTIASIKLAHRLKGVEIVGNNDEYKRSLRGMRRKHKDRLKQKQARPVLLVDLKVAIREMSSSLQGTRDKALIALAFFSAMRRSELVGLDVEHISFTDKGLEILLFGSKTSDNLETIHIEHFQDSNCCPVVLLKAWIMKSQIQKGAVFRSLLKGGSVSPNRLSGHSVGHVMKRVFGEGFSGHSTRRGIVTELGERGVPTTSIMKVTRHKSRAMIDRYTEAKKGYDGSSTRLLGGGNLLSAGH